MMSTIGTYVPVDSPVHRLDPVAKMGLVTLLAGSVFTVEGFAGLAALALLVAVATALARVPARVALRGLRGVVVILVFTVVFHAFEWAPATVSLVRMGPLAISAAGLLEGLFFAARVVVLVVGTSILTLTTPTIELADGMERVMRPLAWIRVPVHEIAMMLTIALRFVPTTASEAERIMTAQAARGAPLTSGGPVRRAKAFGPVLVPLFAALFRRADELALAMDARCYRGGEGRTRMKHRRMGGSDWLTLAGGGIVLAAVGLVM